MRLLLTIFTVFFLTMPPAAPASDTTTTNSIERQLDIRFGHVDGQDLFLDAFIPEVSDGQTTESRPAILFVHGGGWAGGHRAGFHPAAQWFAERGYVCFSAGYRLVREGKNTWPVQLDDVQLATRWIRENAKTYSVDPAKIGALGGSAGGHLVTFLALMDASSTAGLPLGEHSSMVQCSVNLAGPSDLTLPFPGRIDPPGIAVQKLVDDLIGTTGPEWEKIARSASPIFQVTAKASPLLIIHGTDDPIVPVEHATRLHSALKESGVKVQLVLLENEGHNPKPENFQRVLKDSMQFFERHLRRD